MAMTNLPRLYIKDKFSRLIHPASLGISQNITPLDTASITLPKGEEMPSRSYVELFTPYGSAGMFRVRSPHDVYGESYSTAELEHMIAEVGDYVVKDEISKMMSATSAVSTVFSYYKGSHWQLGSYSAIGTASVAVEAKYDSVLNVLLSILEQVPECMMKFDFTGTKWKLNIVKKGTSVVSEGRLSRNVKNATVTYDDSELVTRVWYQTFSTDSEGNVTGKWVSKDASTLKTYGIVESKVSTSSDMTDAEINATVNAYLREHKQPRTTVTIQAEELSQITGERRDKFVIGDLFRLAIPDYDIVTELNISSISWADVYNRPDNVNIVLGDEEDTVVTFLHNLDATGSGTTGGSGGGGGKKKNEDKWKEYFTSIEQTDTKIELTATRVDKANNILEQAGMKLNSKGVLTYAKDKENHVGSLINQQAERISLVVSGTGKNAKINTASIILGINSAGSSVKIKADRIDLTGYVTASQLEAVNAQIHNLMTGRAVASTLWATTVSTSVLKVANSQATWQVKNIPGVGYINYLGA